MKRILYLAALVLALAAGACSDTEQFRVNGTIKGKPSQNLRVGYYADGVFHSQITAASFCLTDSLRPRNNCVLSDR